MLAMTPPLTALTVAAQAVAALKWEVRFSPKPGLVDAQSTGVHTDMDLALFLKSAMSLQPALTSAAIASHEAPVDLTLRAQLGSIGRQAEQAMFAATNGVNTHKGAIWTFSLLIAGLMGDEQPTLTTVLTRAQALAQLSDPGLPMVTAKSHGQVVQQRYRLPGAKGEAQAGFPHLRQALAMVEANTGADRWYRGLLSLLATVDDTNIVYRSDLATLRAFQTQAAQLLTDPQPVLTNPAYQRLCQFAIDRRISPGGSADLFAATYFLTQFGLTK
ncbi:triphosphoribosyl-dephospho-CoA synthase [Lactiplantibacillus mudanjiangensis]|uniref:triphosphoribosyl-dephospho-CoA synthase n=1 Tax=Lactiplantibacillus mudanjiangensis TaxID=1296538 RepID=A0A660E294_9LACO|nr:triphosphoribosyl-dephospho-CoA synthase [Lactiplantibacillus mudanjiangensis]VDG17742.1 triphosphoribosyl-dephospho-CoA synthase [Lactobacillus sp.] [Lactiplantibacillus mudanjiangensis]VDG26272.1 triphosphoribosyl-dephospho-CoA synthase [Lactobacillus sp.] [Lactiplantibacillus mudanjiangensis]VDG29454.1 triphosphoribosyl-dephospho-CoA synthase [Lactobacillus sp.] [Lactiplantibacillus mudanjiangensis]VDG32567.1 triphosphoribosyl-dephospho-CoA synthase [Lactobacillus sp.] [Lactiplantibacillu